MKDIAPKSLKRVKILIGITSFSFFYTSQLIESEAEKTKEEFLLKENGCKASI